MAEATADLAGQFERMEFEEDAVRQMGDLAFASSKTREQFEQIVQQAGKTDPLRHALGLILLCRYAEALAALEKAPNSKYKHYWKARASMGMGRYADALPAFRAAASAGWSALQIDMHCAAALLFSGDAAAAQKLVSQHERAGMDRAEWRHAAGLLAEHRGDRETALEHFNAAIKLDPNCEEAMFRAARLHDLTGDDDRAVELYQSLAARPRSYVHALLNLAVLCEDRGRFDEALRYLRCVLAVHPNHTRARLFLKDVLSSREMMIDEVLEQRADKRNRLLDTPIGEFEVSVRARNCLKKMNIRTLGDLIKLTEEELMAYKNFGETSLLEVRALLAKRGLRLGQKPDEIDVSVLPEEPPPAAPKVNLPPGAEALLAKPVSELELSVRSRRCLQRLNVVTVGDLLQHTEADLLAARNFGQTSLNEVKLRLGELGLSLAAKH